MLNNKSPNRTNFKSKCNIKKNYRNNCYKNILDSNKIRIIEKKAFCFKH